MSSSLEQYVDQVVNVITCDGRNLIGILRGFDQMINLILDDCHERIYSTQQALERQALGLYLIRGENVAIVGELDIDKEADMDITQQRGEQLKPVIH